ncbi:hypothetical protein ACOBQX_24055 [Actinokineospora sp. G85]|uniref:hypothetical protein n=1 Tax=Actinokineospora sp. G85 TaxID=3406626 RepID=UPI003C76C8F5
MAASNIKNAVTEALSHSEPADIIDGVKTAVAKELEELDAAVDIHTTSYFNHSYVPDLVVKWQDNGRTEERSVYLRYTMEAAALGGDIPALGIFGPIVLTLKDGRDEDSIQLVQENLRIQPRLLLTNISTLEDVSDMRATDSPLLPLIKGNIVRGARGLFDSTTVENLRVASNSSQTTQGTPLPEFSELVERSFVDESAFKLRRAAALIRIGLSEDADVALAEALSESSLTGILSDPELRVLLPYLLSKTEVAERTTLWRHIGTMMTLDRLESMASDLGSLDLGPLVRPNLATWTAVRASATAQAEDDAQAEPTKEYSERVQQQGWQIHAKMLALRTPRWTFHVTADGRKLRGRHDSSAALWTDLEPSLRNFALTRVKLQGASRLVDLSSDEADDVRSDVVKITTSLEDRFFVPIASVRDEMFPDGARIDADFTKMLATSTSRSSVLSLIKVAAKILAYRQPEETEVFDLLLTSANPSAESSNGLE